MKNLRRIAKSSQMGVLDLGLILFDCFQLLHLSSLSQLCCVFHLTLSSSARANITLSGKKKRKLLKQLQHMQQEKASMEGNYGLN